MLLSQAIPVCLVKLVNITKPNLIKEGKTLRPLEIGEKVAVQNQTGNKPKRWSNTGRVVEVLPHRQS